MWGCEFVCMCAIQFSKVLPIHCKSHILCLLTTPCMKLHLLLLVVTLQSAAKWYDDLGNLCRFMSVMFTTVCFSCGISPRRWIYSTLHMAVVEGDEWFRDEDYFNTYQHLVSNSCHKYIHTVEPPVLNAACMCCSRAPQWTFLVGGNSITQPQAHSGIQTGVPVVISHSLQPSYIQHMHVSLPNREVLYLRRRLCVCVCFCLSG